LPYWSNPPFLIFGASVRNDSANDRLHKNKTQAQLCKTGKQS